MSPKRRGFLMRDLLILIAIIAIAVPLFVLWPMAKVDEVGPRHLVMWNLRDIAYATHALHDVYHRLPPATGTFGGMMGGNRSLSVHLLPYLEDGAAIYEALKTRPTVSTVAFLPFQAPLDETTKDFVRVQNFAANVRVFTDLGMQTPFDVDVVGITPKGTEGWNNAKIPDSFPDGTGTTIMFSTRMASQGAIAWAGNVNCSAYDALIGQDNSAFFGVKTLAAHATAHTDRGWQRAPSLSQVNCDFGAVAHSLMREGIFIGMVDASCRRMSSLVSPKTWNAAMQPNDGIALGSDW